MKNFVIALIHKYQDKAPESIRSVCLFEPTCSEYMIIAIEKYGTAKGVFLGIKRILRCKEPNGGVDYP